MSLLDSVIGVSKIASLFGSGKSKSSGTTTGSSQEAGFSTLDELLRALSFEENQSAQVQNTSNVTNETARSTATSTAQTKETETGRTVGTDRVSSAGSETQIQTRLNEQLLGGLESLLGTLVGGGGGALGAGQTAIQQRIGGLGNNTFDVEGFVSGIMTDAQSRSRSGLESDINGLASSVGGTGAGNSMVALLNQRLRDDSAANLAGVQAQATAQGEAIRGRQSEELATLAQSGAQGMLGLLSGLLGARTESEVASELGQVTDRSASQTRDVSGTATQQETGLQTSTGTTTGKTETASESLVSSAATNAKQQQAVSGLNRTQTGSTNAKGSGDPFEIFGKIASLFGESSAKA